MPAGVVEGLPGRAHREDNEVIDFALLLWLHPLVGIEAAVGAVAARNLHRDFTGNVGYIEMLDFPRSAFACEQSFPSWFNAASQRCEHPQSGNDHTSHRPCPAPATRPSLVGSLRFARGQPAAAAAGRRAVANRKALGTRFTSPETAPAVQPS